MSTVKVENAGRARRDSRADDRSTSTKSSETGTPVQTACKAATRVPKLAGWLGALGLIPFVALAIASHILEPAREAWVARAVAVYGAIILSFLGGIHWGLSIAGGGPTSRASAIQLGTSVLPALIAWAALFLPRPLGHLVLAAAFGFLLLFDLEASRKGAAPSWYPRLRAPLTIIAVASLGITSLV